MSAEKHMQWQLLEILHSYMINIQLGTCNVYACIHCNEYVCMQTYRYMWPFDPMTGVQGAEVYRFGLCTCGPGDKASLLLLFHFHWCIILTNWRTKNAWGRPGNEAIGSIPVPTSETSRTGHQIWCQLWGSWCILHTKCIILVYYVAFSLIGLQVHMMIWCSLGWHM